MSAADPFLHLENLDEFGEEFAKQHHQKTVAAFTTSDEYTALQADILSQLQDDNQIPFCQEHRARMYHFYQNADYPKGVYRVCTAASYRSGFPQWDVLFNVTDFEEILGDDVYLEGVSHYVNMPNKVLVTLSQAGSDQAYTLEVDLETSSLVDDGFHFPLGKSNIAWRDENSVWFCPAWDERQLTPSGYSKQVWLLERGQTLAEATPVFQLPNEDDMMVHAWRYLDAQGSPIDLIEAAHSFFQKDYYCVDKDLNVMPLGLPQDADIVGYLAGHLLVKLHSDWQRSAQRYPQGSLLAVRLSKGQVGPAVTLFTPTNTQSLESVETTKQFVVIHTLDNVNGRLQIWQFKAGQWQQVKTPRLPEGTLELVDQPWGGDVLYIAASDFITPLTLYVLDLNVMELCVMRRQSAQFDASQLSVQQLWCNSEDGTAIPYYHVGQANQNDPKTPTIVYVYGGFGVSELPHYLGIMGRHWLSKGYSFVIANTRGGGEFGPHWHKAAQGKNKQKTVDDLHAVVADLCNRQLSTPAHIALQGGSNGGLITAAAFAQKPHSIGALVCEVPLTDMLRYHHLFAGCSWVEEYGHPEHPDDVQYLQSLSPYHALSEHISYPEAMITTCLNDDRVHPAHALKFFAKLKSMQQTAYLFAPEQGGHTSNGTQSQIAAELAAIFMFLYQNIAQ